LKREGFRHIHILKSPEEVEAVEIHRKKLWTDLRDQSGPFDIIGDIHGCFDELYALLIKLGYKIEQSSAIENFGYHVTAPEERRIVFLGDLIDRGPKIPQVLRLVMSMVKLGIALCVQGNHESKYLKYINGKKVKISYGLQQTIEQMEAESDTFKDEVKNFLWDLRSHYLLNNWKLVVAHAGMKEMYQGRASGRVRAFAIYGETTGETDMFGLPVRYNWAKEYRGNALVVYGHTPVLESEWLNKTINIDTGCVFGGKLTALRYPEEELVAVPAAKAYSEPAKPLDHNSDAQLSAQHEDDDLLYLEDVIGKRIISTQLRNNIIIREEYSAAALEVMSRFAVNPKWLIYLPPTISPSETSTQDGFLEHPTEAFAYFEKQAVQKVVMEEKHMGSRVIIVICQSEKVAQERFGIIGEGIGICYTRTGRSFFTDSGLEQALLNRLKLALDKTNFWHDFNTQWACFDCELMPWSMKAQELIKQQYAAVGASSNIALSMASELICKAKNRGIDMGELPDSFAIKVNKTAKYTAAYRQYCWSVNDINDLKVAPFHIMATEGNSYFNKDHIWHMQEIAKICAADPDVLLATKYKLINIADKNSKDEGMQWWLDLTANGGEGLVIKPYNFIEKGKKGLIQPALKCRGAEYLRIIYGPEYDTMHNLNALRKRGLSTKRSMAIRELALGFESLKRFVNHDPLR
ncbi:MAG: polynucleotide kinase-phosphatase, partial [Mariprofundales bacterium]